RPLNWKMPEAEFGLYSLYRENISSPPQVKLCRPLIHCQECVSSMLVRANSAGFKFVLRFRLLVPLMLTLISLDWGCMFTPRSAMDLGNGMVRLPTSRAMLMCVSEIKLGLGT